MAGKSPVTASEPQRAALLALSVSPERGEADRARAMLLTLAGWTSPKIAEAFGVREDTVGFWRGAFLAGGVEALKARVAPGPVPVKSEAALRVVTPLLEAPVADRDFVAWRLRSARWRRREINYATRTQMACPRSRIRLSDLTAIATSVTRRASSRDFKISPITRL